MNNVSNRNPFQPGINSKQSYAKSTTNSSSSSSGSALESGFGRPSAEEAQKDRQEISKITRENKALIRDREMRQKNDQLQHLSNQQQQQTMMTAAMLFGGMGSTNNSNIGLSNNNPALNFLAMQSILA